MIRNILLLSLVALATSTTITITTDGNTLTCGADGRRDQTGPRLVANHQEKQSCIERIRLGALQGPPQNPGALARTCPSRLGRFTHSSLFRDSQRNLRRLGYERNDRQFGQRRRPLQAP